MGTLTIRTNEQQDQIIEDIKAYYDEAAGTKAVLKAANDVPQMHNEIERLKKELLMARQQIREYESATFSVLSGLDSLRMLSEK
ncbi:hypothetical protein [Vibrio quintilis]|uniref:Uncharacterized protein n=1 Tax=Vibrio quintilis TaxID=1117707 RepID=A0A1M7YPD0_9VIBR|nr:hypothetical protein [Vibrio quintilis]SHO54488.1 hypothetical protein VQ7734_00202 [Vibrio quintilis]